MPLSQRARTLAVTTPLGEDVLLLRSMSGREHLSTLFEYQLELISESYQPIKHEDLLGQPVTVRLDLPNDQTRYFNGLVSRFSHTGFDGSLAIYQATLVPWFWLLSRTTDCRIFQNRTVPDIVKEIFREHGYIDFQEFLINELYLPRRYCVQYRETDFAFISRLLEQEGIHYFFRHEADKHTLVLADDNGAHHPVAGYEEIPYYPPDETALRERDYIDHWSVAGSVQPGVFVHTDFDYKKPRYNLLAGVLHPHEHARADLERYDYPGGYTQPDQGDDWVRARIEELHVDYETTRGAGNARGLATGAHFKLTKYPRDDQNREYLLLSAEYKLQSDAFGSSSTMGGAPNTGPVFHCEFTALDAKTPYRPPRNTPKARVQGPQTAIVVGKAGEELWTDQYGRVKVQFHWDRYGQSDEQSSCWVRVSHPWAGKNWGAVAIPRIGQEVIVDFLEGDPDRPIITGRVYNDVTKPPYKLPAGAAISGLMSNSTKGGGGYNEYIMDDTKGQELIREHGQFDKDSTIEHDLREHVLNDRSRDVTNNETIRIGKDRAKTVDHDETSYIKHDRTETVDHDERISIHGKRTETVDKNETLTIHGARTKTVDQDEHIQIGHDRSTHIVNNENLEISRNHNLHVAQNETIHIGYNRKASIFNNEAVGIGRDHSQTIGANQTIIVGANRTENVGGNETETVGANKAETIAIAKALNVGAAYQVTVGAAMNTSVGGAKLEEIGLYSMQAIGGDRTAHVKGDATEEIGGNRQVTIQGDRNEQVAGAVVLKAGKNLILEAGESITLKVGGGYLVVDPTGVTVSNVPPGKPVVNRASPPQAGMGDAADSQPEKTANKGKGGGFFSAVLGILGWIWALPNTLIGLAYGGIGMLFGATPVWDSQAGILRFINMPSWMMPSAMSFGHVHLFGPNSYMLNGEFVPNEFQTLIVEEELLHTRQAEVLGPFYLPLHIVTMGVSALISVVKPPSKPGRTTHEYNLLEMGPEHGTGPWPWS